MRLPQVPVAAMRLNLCCGTDVRAGWVNVDLVPTDPSVNVWNLEEFPWPFEDSSASEIRCIDGFEHLDPRVRVGFMTECHRILEPRGWLFIQTTHYTCIDAYTDPTHYGGGFTEYTFDYWVRGTLYHKQNAMYGGVDYEKVECRLNRSTGQLEARLRKIPADA